MSLRKKQIIFAAIVTFIAIATFTACEPAENAPPPEYPEQIEGTIDLTGDSVTFGTYWGTGVPQFQTSGQWLPGDAIDQSPYGGIVANDRIPQELAKGNIDIEVWALGLNEIAQADRTWTDMHQLMWYNILVQHIPKTTCIVMVKPWVLPGGYGWRPPEEMAALRAFIDDLVEDHQNIISVDWKPIAEANPDFMAEDGVHLNADNPDAAFARNNMYLEGVNACP